MLPSGIFSKRAIPNAFTLGNLLCGVLGIWWLFHGKPMWSVGFMWVAAFFDFLDGALARALKVAGGLGKDLDSLADGVTFGVLPALMLAWVINMQTGNDWFPMLSFLIALAAAYRLAVFNQSTDQKTYFIGVPTPAAALAISAMFYEWYWEGKGVLYTTYGAVIVGIVISWLMVSPLKIIAFKGGNGLKGIDYYLLFVGCLVLGFLVPLINEALTPAPLIFVWYLGFSQYALNRKK